jgi:Leucine-rich repeat (LRR) protein
MLTLVSLKTARNSPETRESIVACSEIHITERIDELRPEDFKGCEHIKGLMIGPRLDEVHAENSGYRPSRTKATLIPEHLFSALKSLRHLEIRMKGITELGPHSFKDLPNLRSLTLSSNRIVKIHPKAFVGLENLTSLFLDHNRLGEIDDRTFSSLRSLNVLHLESNRIRKIHSRAFEQMGELASLNLQRNQICKIDSLAFQGLNCLATLDISANPIGVSNLSFMRALGNSTEISIQTKRGNLRLSKAAFLNYG